MKPQERITELAQDLLSVKNYQWMKINLGMKNCELKKAIQTHGWTIDQAQVINRYHEILL